MKKTLMILSLSTGLFLGAVTVSEAQKSRVRYADQQMELMNYRHAIEEYKLAYAKKPGYELAVKLAEAHETARDYDGSYEWWKNVVGYEQADSEDYLNYLSAAQHTGRMDAVESDLAGKEVNVDSLK